MLTPEIYQVQSNTQETPDIFTLVLSPRDKKRAPDFMPGQFTMLYCFGIGESAISISSDPRQPHELSYTIRAVGHVTRGLQKLKKGDEVGVRGPFGSHWPLVKKGSDVVLIAGGVGLAPLHSALLYLMSHRQDYKKIKLLYGSKKPEDVLYSQEMKLWQEQGVEVALTVDVADSSWKGEVGVVTRLIENAISSPKETLALLCGPEIMLKYAIDELLRAQVEQDNIHIAMERNMQCAVGFCGHCLYGPHFICKDGPIFPYTKIHAQLAIKEL